jgi:phospholipid/cholesterol/gamma-HCH transport system ATP-binding protein
MAEAGESLLRFENVVVRFDNDVRALDGLSFDVREGETRIILGAAGSGKTVLLKVAMALVRPTSGRIFLFGQDVTEKPEPELF